MIRSSSEIYTFLQGRSSRKHVCFAFIARIIPMSLPKTKLCQQRLPQFGVSSTSCKGSKIRHDSARATTFTHIQTSIKYLDINYLSDAGLRSTPVGSDPRSTGPCEPHAVPHAAPACCSSFSFHPKMFDNAMLFSLLNFVFCGSRLLHGYHSRDFCAKKVRTFL